MFQSDYGFFYELYVVYARILFGMWSDKRETAVTANQFLQGSGKNSNCWTGDILCK